MRYINALSLSLILSLPILYVQSVSIMLFSDCFFRLNELHFALSDYQQALEMDSSDWSVRCRLSIVYNEFGILEYYDRHYLEAIDHLTTCIRYNPRIGAYYLSRARARYMIEVQCITCNHCQVEPQYNELACVAGVQSGGRGESGNSCAKCEESTKCDRWDLVPTHFILMFLFAHTLSTTSCIGP